MKYNGKTIIAKADAGTYDIIDALLKISPGVIDQVKNEVKKLNLTGNAVNDALIIGNYIRSNVKYKADGYKEQNIQLPGRMFNGTKEADCKSFSLAFFSLMSAAGYKVGYRFASYRKNKIPTHVYNWFLDNDKNFYTFDTCIKNFKESKRFTFIKDMQVNYLTGVNAEFINGKKERQAKREARKEKRQERKEQGKGLFQGVKKIALSGPRTAFRGLVSLNVRGIATRLSEALTKNPDRLKDLWKKFGGTFDKLQESINTGKTKKPLLGKGRGVNGLEFDYISEVEFDFIGEPVTAAALITSASAILIPVQKLLDELGIRKTEGEDIITPDEVEEAVATGNKITDPNFKPSDPEGMSFAPSPMLIGGLIGAAALVYFLTKKKR
jgi:hypothetical protein